MVTDPIADLLTRIKNAIARKSTSVNIPYSGIVEDIVKLLKEKTIINGYSIETPEADDKSSYRQREIKVEIAYDDENGRKVSRITDLKRVSKPGVRSYSGYRDMKKIRSGFGVAVVSTSRGLMTDVEARKEKVGGEVLFEIW